MCRPVARTNASARKPRVAECAAITVSAAVSNDVISAPTAPRPIACWSRQPWGEGGEARSSKLSSGRDVNPGGYAIAAPRALGAGARRPYRSVSDAATGRSEIDMSSAKASIPCSSLRACAVDAAS